MVAYASVRVSTAQHEGEHQRSGVWASAHARRDRRTGVVRRYPEGAAREVLEERVVCERYSGSGGVPGWLEWPQGPGWSGATGLAIILAH